MKQLFSISFLIILMGVNVIAQDEYNDGLTLMQIEQGAKVAGMGGTSVALISSPDLTAYNPAAAVGVEKFTVSFGHISYWENIRLESGYFAKDMNDRWYFHGGLKYATDDKIEERQYPTAIPDGLFSAHDISIKSGLAYKLSDKVNIGLALGWFIEKIGNYRGSAFNLDFGLQSQINEKLSLGASVTNLGKHFHLTLNGLVGSRYITLPTTYRIGAAYKVDKYIGTADIVYLDDEVKIHVGTEANVHEYFLLRAGYMANYDSKSFTAGSSFIYRNMIIDYGFVPYSNNLGTSHLFNITFSL